MVWFSGGKKDKVFEHASNTQTAALDKKKGIRNKKEGAN